MSVYWSILEQLMRSIPDFVDLSGTGAVPGIKREAVVIRRTPLKGQEWMRDEMKPGIVLSPSNVVDVPLDLGNVNEDDVWYPVLIQVIDADEGRYQPERIQAQLQWTENLRKFLHGSNLRNNVFAEAGYVDWCVIEGHDVLDEGLWELHKNCVSAMAFKALSREPRNPEGTV